MKAYVWGAVDFLAEYIPGVALAVAESREEAIKLIVEDFFSCYRASSGLEKELRDTSPDVYDLPFVFWERGSA